MPNETRTISFSNAEAMAALVEYCATTKRELPKAVLNVSRLPTMPRSKSKPNSTATRHRSGSTRTRWRLR